MGIFEIFGLKKNSAPKNPSFEEQLQVFEELGFKFNEGANKSELEIWEPQAFLDEPFALMYIALGQTIEREPWTPLTDQCWNFDTEAIEDHGSYIDIIKNLERITRGELKFENVKDYVDIEAEEAWVSFTFRGKDYKWILKVDDDWVDINLFSKIVELTIDADTKGNYTYYDTGGQSAVFGFETTASRKALKKRTGLKIDWLR